MLISVYLTNPASGRVVLSFQKMSPLQCHSSFIYLVTATHPKPDGFWQQVNKSCDIFGQLDTFLSLLTYLITYIISLAWLRSTAGSPTSQRKLSSDACIQNFYSFGHHPQLMNIREGWNMGHPVNWKFCLLARFLFTTTLASVLAPVDLTLHLTLLNDTWRYTELLQLER